MRYTISMSKDVSFALDQKGGEDILQRMSASVVKTSADAIAARATGMASSLTSNPPSITVSTKVGTIKRGIRAIATIKAEGADQHENYIGHIALTKAKDAGRV